jgi:hypothetical protein
MQRAVFAQRDSVRLYKDTRVPKLLDYKQLAPQYVTYRIYGYFGENGREPLTVLGTRFPSPAILHKPNLG